jgi:hypothetical protein
MRVRDVLGGVDITKEDRAAAERGGFGKELATVNVKRVDVLFHSFGFPSMCLIIQLWESRERKARRLLKSGSGWSRLCRRQSASEKKRQVGMRQPIFPQCVEVADSRFDLLFLGA